MPRELEPTFQDITPAWRGLPAGMSSWYITSIVSGISQEALPWMLAQGWQLNAVQTDDSVSPPIETYLMARTKLLNQNVLLSLMIDFTNSFNEGRAANDKRYKDVVWAWQNVLDKYQADMEDFRDDKVYSATGYVTVMLSQVSELGTDFDSMQADYDSYDSGDRAGELVKLKTTWSAAADTAQAEYDTMTSGLDLPAIIADIDSAMDDFDAAITTFNTTYATLGATLLTDFTTHQTLARGFLTDLGTSELARINENFANSLATQSQGLVDRGFYSSAITTDITNRNTRDRDDAISALNDRLNREKLGNQHTLYEEQFKMRLGGLEAAMKAIDASGKAVSLRLQQGEWSSEIRHKVATLSVQSRLAVLGLREKYYKTLLDSITWESDRRTQLYDRLVQVRLKQFELRGRTLDKEMELLKYQLDERNNIAASLFGFVERRTDAYPDQNSMAQLATNLGETGASTWQSA